MFAQIVEKGKKKMKILYDAEESGWNFEERDGKLYASCILWMWDNVKGESVGIEHTEITIEQWFWAVDWWRLVWGLVEAEASEACTLRFRFGGRHWRVWVHHWGGGAWDFEIPGGGISESRYRGMMDALRAVAGEGSVMGMRYVGGTGGNTLSVLRRDAWWMHGW